MMYEAYLPQTMPSHKSALVHISVYSVDVSLSRILPDDVVGIVVKHRHT